MFYVFINSLLLKIVTWNCNGAFRNKFEKLLELDADIYVIQECEDPSCCINQEYQLFAANSLWIGDNKHKGLGIFAKPGIHLEKLNWSNVYQDHSVKYFLPCSVNGSFDLLAIWAHSNKSPTFGYIGQLWKYLQINLENMDQIILIGDLNSNAIWDKWDRWWNHSDVLNLLEKKGIKSIYHYFKNEKQGEETIPTFFHRKNIKTAYHIDYIFSSAETLEKLKYFEIGNSNDWLKVSDHFPLVSDFDI